MAQEHLDLNNIHSGIKQLNRPGMSPGMAMGFQYINLKIPAVGLQCLVKALLSYRVPTRELRQDIIILTERIIVLMLKDPRLEAVRYYQNSVLYFVPLF